MPQIASFAPKNKVNLGRRALPIITRGQKAWTHLNHDPNWRDWGWVGKAIEIGRSESMAIARAKKPEGRRYNTAFHDWLERYGFAGISKSTRAHLLKCMANLEAIEEWRATLMPDDLLRFNHPTTVLRAWQKATAAPPASNPKLSDATPPVPTVAEVRRLIKRLAAGDLEVLIHEILHDRPNLVPHELREQLLRQNHRRDDLAYPRIAKRAREITALCHHPEQHVDSIRKAAAEILRTVEPEVVKPVAAAPAPVGDLSAWERAMNPPATTKVQ